MYSTEMHRNGEGAIQGSGKPIQNLSNCLQLCLISKVERSRWVIEESHTTQYLETTTTKGLLCLFDAQRADATMHIEERL